MYMKWSEFKSEVENYLRENHLDESVEIEYFDFSWPDNRYNVSNLNISHGEDELTIWN